MTQSKLIEKATSLLDACKARGVMIATAESCTGGMIVALLTEIAGSSAVVDRGFVTYSNEAKQQMLGVSEALIAEHGAVSEPVARAMAEGALAQSRAQLSVSVTGVAGPGGGSDAKPVGTVHLASALEGGEMLHHHTQFDGDRQAVRTQSVEAALDLMLRQLAA